MPYYPNPYSQPYNAYPTPQQRLQALEQQYPAQYGQMTGQAMQTEPAQHQQNSIMLVKNEQQARDYPLDLSGSPMIFIMEDDSKIFAKRFNVSNALPEFEIYERASHSIPQVQAQDNSPLLGLVGDFTARLDVLHDEIKSIKEAVLNGNKSGGDSETVSKSKSANATNNKSSAANGASGK